MGFDIPMNTKGALDLNTLFAGNNSGTANQNIVQQSNQQNFAAQQPMQQYSQPNQYSQPAHQYNQQQVQQNTQPQQQFVQQSNNVQKTIPSGNGVHLKKGQKFALAGANGAQLSSIKVCLGWDVINQACDLDASAFMLGADGKVLGDDWFVFYGQTTSPDGSIQHSGDSQGEGTGDDEIITINLQTVNPNVQKITFVVTINEALERGLNFSMVQNAYVRVIDIATGQELSRFLLTDYYANVTSMVVGEVYRHNGAWKFNAVGDGVAKDLAGLCAMYGVNVAD